MINGGYLDLLFRRLSGVALLAASIALMGCPPPAPESINILDPKDLEAHDIDLGSELASIPISIDLTSSSGRPLQVGSFQAFVIEDLPGVEPDDLDENGNPIEQPVEITSHFTVDYQAETATLTTPVELPMAWYFLEAKVLDDQNVAASDLVVFSVDYPGPLFVGSTESPFDIMLAYIRGVHDECFNGVLNGFWPEGYGIDVANVPTFNDILAAGPSGLPVDLELPPPLAPDGVLTFLAKIINNAILLPQTQIDPIDLGPPTHGLIPCAIGFQVMADIRRVGPEWAAPKFLLQNFTVADAPSGGACWLQTPPAGCQTVLDLEAIAYPPPHPWP